MWQKKLRFSGFFVRARNFVDLLARLLGIEHRAWQRREPAGFGDRSGQLEIHRTGHRREHDRMFDFEEIEEPAVGPHGTLPSTDCAEP